MQKSDSERWAGYVAFLLPLCIYVCSAAGEGYWLDGGEFTAAATQLDIAHPPGHPLFSLWSKPFTLLPVGALPFRVALAGAFAAALGLLATQRAFARSFIKSSGLGERPASWLSLAATFALAGSYGFWFQAVRAEVYALEAMLVCFAFERLSIVACGERVGDPRPLYQACFALGLGLTNHHFIAVLALPSLLWATFALVRACGPRVLGMCVFSGLCGLFCYIYLPLRSSALPPMDLGHPHALADFWWVISAQVYAKKIGSAAVQPLDERFADLVVLLVENFTPFVLPLALLGLYALVRARRYQLAYLWLVSALVSLCGRAYLNEVRDNPDVLGYMLPGFAALIALAGCGVAALLSLLGAALVSHANKRFDLDGSVRARALRNAWHIMLTLSIALTLLGLAQFLRAAPRASLQSFRASAQLDALRFRDLPARSLLVLTTPDVTFRFWENRAVEQLRKDVTVLPLPFVGYGDSDRVWRQRHPELGPLMESFHARGELDADGLRRLSEQRPVFVELDTSTSLPLLPVALPSGLLYRVLPQRPSDEMVNRAGVARAQLEKGLLRTIDLHDPETRRQVLWTSYVEALYYAWRGAFELARAACQQALSLAPQARELLALRDALEGARAPFDIGPFLARHAAPHGP